MISSTPPLFEARQVCDVLQLPFLRLNKEPNSKEGNVRGEVKTSITIFLLFPETEDFFQKDASLYQLVLDFLFLLVEGFGNAFSVLLL